ncbi:hypothetical protein H6G93_36565, partial [Nostoc sp. FACHB-973]|nr:hypothetical protein [Nostoc sp. FACHB-973]
MALVQSSSENTIKATIKDGANIYTDKLDVIANLTTTNISIGATGSFASIAKKAAVNASFSLNDGSDTVLANVSDLAKIVSKGQVNVNASNNTNNYSFAGGFASGENQGVGIGIGLNDWERTTEASIGSTSESLGFDADNNVDIANDTITIKNHGLKTGDIILYSNESGTSVGNLTHDKLYFVIVIDENTIELADSCSKALAGTKRDLTSKGKGSHELITLDELQSNSLSKTVFDPADGVEDYNYIDPDGQTVVVGYLDTSKITNNTITLQNHGLSNGDLITYYNDANDLSGLTEANGETIQVKNLGVLAQGTTYKVINVNGNTFQLAAVNDATNTPLDITYTSVDERINNHYFKRSVIDLNKDIIVDNEHGFATGDRVVYSNGGGTSIGANNGNGQLVDEQTYYIIKVDKNRVKLAQSYSDAINRTAIDLTTTGSGDVHTLRAATVNIDADKINLIGHGYKTGDAVIYNNNGGTSIGANNAAKQLVDEGTYCIIVIDENTVKLADSYANAIAYSSSNNTAIDLTSTGSGTKHSFSLVNFLDLSADTITLKRHDLQSGDAIIYSNGGGTSISTSNGALTDGEIYYAIVIDKNTIKLATSYSNAINYSAINNTAINLTGAGSGTGHQFFQKPTIYLSAGSISAEGSITVSSENTGYNIAGAIAGTYSSGSSNDDYDIDDDERDYESLTGASGGVAVAGDAAINLFSDTTKAYIKDATITAAGQQVSITATSDTDIMVIGGAVALANAKGETSTSSYGIAGSFGFNNVDSNTEAYIDRSTLNIGSTNISATNDNYILSVVASGSGAFNDKGRAIAGSVSDNDITNNTLAYIGNNSDVNATGNVNLNATDSSTILSVAGALEYGGQYGIGASIALNFTDNTTKAYLQNSDVSAAVLALKAENDNDIKSIAAAAGASLGKMAAEFSFTDNDTQNTAAAYIEGSASDDGIDITGDITLNADDNSTILSVAGVFSLSSLSSNNTNRTATLGVSVALNTINNTNQTYIDSTSVTGTGNLTLTTDSFAQIKAYSFEGTVSAAKLSGDGWVVSGAGAGTHNKITNTITAYISDSNSISIAKGAIQVKATDNSTIYGDAGGFAIALAAASQSRSATTGSVGAGIAVNKIANKIEAYVSDATLSAKSVTVSANSTATIEALAIGGSVAGSYTSQGGTALSFSGAGSGTYNEIKNTIAAYLNDDASVTTTAGALSVSATDNSDITANSAGVAIALAITGKSLGTSGSVSVGAAIANNSIENNISAYIDNATANAGGNLNVTASSTSTIDAFAIGAAVAGSYTSKGLGVTLTGAGAGSSNWVDNSITAYISDVSSTKPVSTSNGGSITISASDASEITADAGGYSVGLSLGSSALSGNLSIGVSIANNDIGNTVQAYIDNATVSSAGGINITAIATDTIDALGIGGSASGSVGTSSGAALNLSGAGAGVTNSIDNTITATIQNGSNVSTSNNSDISLTATDNSDIISDAGGIAIALAFGSSSFNASVGASVGTNKIGKEEGHFIKAYIDNSTVTADGNLSISATSTATIDALAFSGSAAGSGGSGAGLNFTGTAAISNNDIAATIQAKIANVSGAMNAITNTPKSVTTKNGFIKLTALDSSNITADAGGMAIALGVSSGASAGLSVGFSIADNTIANTTQALIDRASVNAKTTLDLGAKFNGWIDTFALGGAFTVAAGSKGGAAFSGAGAGSYNTITNTIEAAIINNSDVDAGSPVTLKAEDATTDSNGNQIRANQVKALAVGTSVSAAAGSGGAGSLAISAVVVDNTFTNKVRAYIGKDSVTTDTTTVDAPSIILNATSTANIESTAAAVAVAASFSKAGIGLSGGGANITNTLTNTIATLIQGGSTVTASTGAIKLTASDTPTITSSVGSGAGVLAPLGGSIAVSLTDITVNNTVKAAIEQATVNAKSGDITLDVDSKPTLTAISVATSIAIALGGSGAGAEADATISSNVSAYIGDRVTINTKNLNIWADSNDSATTNAYGISGSSIAAIGASMATSKVNGSTRAYAGSNNASAIGTTINATGVDIAAIGTGK